MPFSQSHCRVPTTLRWLFFTNFMLCLSLLHHDPIHLKHTLMNLLPRLLCCLLLVGSLGLSHAQRRADFHPQHSYRQYQSLFQNDTLPNPTRTRWVSGASLGTYAVAMTGLGSLWYSEEELSSFHFFDDSHQWQQMDKVGHAYSGYHLTRGLVLLYRWSGQPKTKTLLWSGSLAWFMAGSVEIFDAFGETWGFRGQISPPIVLG